MSPCLVRVALCRCLGESNGIIPMVCQSQVLQVCPLCGTPVPSCYSWAIIASSVPVSGQGSASSLLPMRIGCDWCGLSIIVGLAPRSRHHLGGGLQCNLRPPTMCIGCGAFCEGLQCGLSEVTMCSMMGSAIGGLWWEARPAAVYAGLEHLGRNCGVSWDWLPHVLWFWPHGGAPVQAQVSTVCVTSRAAWNRFQS